MAQAHAFDGDIPEKYDRCLGPILFEPYAIDLAARIPKVGVKDVLELACGTGIVTKQLRMRLADDAKLVATDLSEGMLAIAKRKADMGGKIEWKAVDATKVPFKDGAFDWVVCQFGLMFFPDKAAAYEEVIRVLRPGGRFVFNVWQGHEKNDFARLVRETVIPMFQEDPPGFYNVPFGYSDQVELRRALREAGFVDVAITEVEKACLGSTAHEAAVGFVEGNPISVEIRERLGRDPSEVTAVVEKALSKRFGCGGGSIKGSMSALVISGKKPL